MSGVIGSLGLSPALGGILAGAVKGAAIGSVGALLTGQDFGKGALLGGLAGGAIAGVTGATVGATAGNTANKAGQVLIENADGTIVNAAGDVTQAAGTVAPGASFSEAFAPFQQPAAGGLESVMNAGSADAVAQTTSPISQEAIAGSTAPPSSDGGGGGGLFGGMGGFEKSMLISGLGKGLGSFMDAKSASDAAKARAANYGDGSGLFQLADATGPALPNAADVYGNRIYGTRRLTYTPGVGLGTA